MKAERRKARWLLLTLAFGSMSCGSETIPDKASTPPVPIEPVKAPPELSPDGDASPGGAPPAEAATTPIRLGLPIASYLHGVVWITDEVGYFDEHGIDISIQVLRGDRAVTSNITEGELDVALCAASGVINANLAGGDLVIFAGLVNRLALRVFSMKNIETPEDLVGKAVGVPVLGSPQDWAFRLLMYQSGLDYQDLVVRSLGNEGDFLGELERGDISALASARPPEFIEGRGGRVLADIPKPKHAFPFINLIADRTWLLEQRSTALALTRAICDGMRYYADHREESLEILKPHLAGSKAIAPGMPEEHYAAGGPHLFTYPPDPSRKAIQWLISRFRQRDDLSAENLSAEDLLEFGIVSQLKREGYFQGDEDEQDGI